MINDLLFDFEGEKANLQIMPLMTHFQLTQKFLFFDLPRSRVAQYTTGNFIRLFFLQVIDESLINLISAIERIYLISTA